MRNVLLLLLLGAAPVTAQQARTGAVFGTVLDERASEALPFASVTLHGRTTTTDHRGRFRFTQVPTGPAALQVRLLGYRPFSTRIAVSAGDTTRVEVRLAASAQTLSAVRTRADQAARDRFETIPDVGVTSLDAPTLKSVPPLGERDVMRTVQLLPGVSARSDYSAGYSVRGGEADQNLILLDGIPIYNPYHLYGLFSTFPEGMVGSAEMLTGGFTAEHGGRLSSVLSVASATDPRPGVHGSVAFSLLAANATLGGSLPRYRTTWSVSGRRTYADRLISAATDDVFPYHFRDEHVHVSHVLNNGGSLRVTGYDGADHMSGVVSTALDSTRGASTVRYAWGNSAVGLTWTQPMGERTMLVQRASVTRFEAELNEGEGSRLFRNRAAEWRVAGALTTQVADHRLTAGYEYTQHYVRFRELAPRLTATLQSMYQAPVAVAGFVEDNWRVSERLIARPGLRFERVSGAEWLGVSPRLSAKYFVTRNFALTGAASRHAQWLQSLRREDVPIRAFELWVAADAYIPVATATHLVSGFELWPGAARVLHAEAFWKGYYRLGEPDPADDPVRRGDEIRPVDGAVYGVDVSVKQLEGRMRGWLAYTYSVSTRTQGGVDFFPAQDRRHNLNLVTTWRAPGQVQAAVRFGLASGAPYTPIVGQIVRRAHDPSSGYWETGGHEPVIEPVGGRRNGARYPLYHRLDLSIERAFRKGDATITPSLQLLNAYNRQNVFTYEYHYGTVPPTREAVSQLPLLPAVGLRVEF